MSQTDPKPTNVTVNRETSEVVISWADGAECSYPFDGLRAICPCVECKGGHSKMGGPPDVEKMMNTPTLGISVDQVRAVGSYAIQFHWSDGHWTGIYTWQFLRQACVDG